MHPLPPQTSQRAILAALILLALSACQPTGPILPAVTATLQPAATATPTAAPTATLTPIPSVTPTATPPPMPRNQIAFLSSRDGAFGIYLMNADGSDVKRLVNEQAREVFNFAWSPDGQQIAFESRRNGNADIYVIDANGANLRRLTSGKDDELYPTWSPNGEWIAYATKGWIRVVSARDGNWLKEIPYVLEGSDKPFLGYAFTDLAWSPNSQWLTFAFPYVWNTGFYSACGLDLLSNDQGVKCFFDEAQSASRFLSEINETLTPGGDSNPVWSPDGKQIAYKSHVDGNPEILVMNADGSGQTNLTQNSAADLNPAWQP